ncbi:MAG: hypothetical protein ABIP41_05655 [Croceibacterium sp.]
MAKAKIPAMLRHDPAALNDSVADAGLAELASAHRHEAARGATARPEVLRALTAELNARLAASGDG